jgi:hypothetical protein
MKTAVEWLVEQIYYTDVKITRELLKKAKEMEKEQIENAWNSASGGDAFHNSEQYYKETFKSE